MDTASLCAPLEPDGRTTLYPESLHPRFMSCRSLSSTLGCFSCFGYCEAAIYLPKKGTKPASLVPRRDLAISNLINLKSPWHFEKKKSSNLVRHERTFSNFSSLLKNYYYSLSEQNVGSYFTGKTKVNTIWSSSSSLTLVSQKGISFHGIPSSVTPTLPESFSSS